MAGLKFGWLVAVGTVTCMPGQWLGHFSASWDPCVLLGLSFPNRGHVTCLKRQTNGQIVTAVSDLWPDSIRVQQMEKADKCSVGELYRLICLGPKLQWKVSWDGMTPFVNKDIHLVVMDVPGEACASQRPCVISSCLE